MARVMDVADYIIEESSKDGSPVNNIDLQKYIYFCYARSLVEKKLPLIEDILIEKWRYGVYIKEVYNEYKPYGIDDIKTPDKHFNYNKFKVTDFNKRDLNEEDKDLIKGTIKGLRKYNGVDLEKEIHKQKSWKDFKNRILLGEKGLYYTDKEIIRDFSSNCSRLWKN